MISQFNSLIDQKARAMAGPYALALMPLLTLLAYWAGGETALLLAAVVLPALVVYLARHPTGSAWSRGEIDALTGSIMRDGLIDWIEDVAPQAAKLNREVAVVALVIDDLNDLEERFGRDMRNSVVAEAANRLRARRRANFSAVAKRVGLRAEIG